MASQQNVELEAAKFLHKLIQDSTDEPAKLATKLYVVRAFLFFGISVLRVTFISDLWLLHKQILQHMKSSGKEHSMPYQVISM